MKPLAANPYCVWIGVWSDAENWWVEIEKSPTNYNAIDYAVAIHAEDLARADE